MLLAMAPSSRKHDNNMELIQQGLIARDSENGQERGRPVSALGYRMTDCSVTSSLGTHTTPTHKASHCRFLTWVAYTRNFAPKITASQRCTCPMIGCELVFDNSESMLQHVQICPRLSKCLYRCLESGKDERIGKCDTEGCQELKGRFATAVNSVKRRFSGRGSKRRQPAESSLENHVTPKDSFDMDSTWDRQPNVTELPFEGSAFIPEMDSAWQTVPHGFCQENSGLALSELQLRVGAQSFPSELDMGNYAVCSPSHRFESRPPPAELDVGMDLPSVPVYVAQGQQLSARVETSNVWANYSEDAAHAQVEPAELYTSGEPTLTHGRDHQQNKCPFPSSQSYAEELTETLEANFPSSSRFIPLLESDDPYRAFRQTVGTTGNSESISKISVEELAYPVSQVASEPMFTNMHHVSRVDSGISSDSSMSQSLFSTVSTMSNYNSSMSSLDLRKPSLDDCHRILPSFLGDSNIMYDEPESIEFLSPPARDNHRLGDYNSSARHTDINGVSIDDYQPDCNIPNLRYQEDSLPNQNQSLRNPTLLSPETTALPLADNENLSPPPLMIPSRSIQTYVIRKASCKFCSFQPSQGTSNLRRHVRSCKRNPSRPKTKPFKCNYPHCRSAFSRRDNLKVHQGKQNHLTFEIQLRINPALLSPGGTRR